jgi:hypothetical protein
MFVEVLSVVALAGCAAAPQRTPIGMSDAVPDRPSAKAPEAVRAPWADFAAAREWPEAAPATLSLGHRRDGTVVHVRVAPPALQAYRALSVESGMPVGARVVAWHESPGGALLGGYLLEKHDSGWVGQELDARGSLVPGDHASCVRCHDMAPTDHLFGSRSATPAGTPAIRGESLDPQGR